MDGNINDGPVKAESNDSIYLPKLVNLADVTPKPVSWLWGGRIALGKVTVIAGDPGLGKSQLAIDLIARVTTGEFWPDGRLNRPGSAVLLSAEDDIEDTIVPRLMAAGADRKLVTAIEGMELNTGDKKPAKQRSFNLESDLPALRQAIDAIPECRIVVIDPISACLGSTDSHKDAEVRAVLHPLGQLAAEKQVAVVAIGHLNKVGGARAVSRVTGSMAFVAAARAAWLVAKDRENPERRLFLPIKNNLAKDIGGLAFRSVSSDGDGDGAVAVEWEQGAVTVSADDALGDNRPRRVAREQEKEWLRELLTESPRTAAFIEQQAAERGFSEKTIRRAKADLGIKSDREGFGKGAAYTWKLPIDGQDSTTHDHVAIYDEQSF